ncbi:MAG: cyclic nucleotide-binding domain-containing protein [Desulfobacterales bacterium]
MVSREDLKKVVIIGYLEDYMLDKLIPFVDLLIFEERETIFKEKEPATRFYMVKRGKVVLEQRISDNITVSVGAIKPGFSFGWSAILTDGTYTSDAVCSEYSEVFSVRSDKLRNLLDNDHSMGYMLTQRILKVIKTRLDHRTEQFIRAVTSHPDIESLLDKQ